MSGKDARASSLGEIFTRDFLILSIINLSVFFGFQMVNVGLPVYLAQLGAEAHVVGLATTLMTVTATLMRVFSGALLDRFGRMGMLIGGTAVIVCSIASYAIFPFVGVILGIRLLHGIGWGMGSTASSTIAADIIPKHRFAEGMGYFAMTTAIASALAPAVSVELVQGPGALVMLFVAVGITVLSLALSIFQLALTRRATTQSRNNGPADKAIAPALKPNGSPAPQAGEAEGESPAPPSRASRTAPPSYSGIETLFERRALFPGLLIFLVNMGFGCITTFIALHAQDRGVSGVSAYFIVYAIVTLLSRPYIGKLIDRYGYRMPAILSSLCTAGTLAFIGAATDIAMFAGAGVLGGLGIGTAMGTFQSMAVANAEPWRRGVATSTYMTAFDLGIAVGSLLGGVVVNLSGYGAMYFTMAVFPVFAGIVSALAVKREPKATDETPRRTGGEE